MRKFYSLLIVILFSNSIFATTKANANITFADSNFKSRLLESSTSNTIAKDLTGSYFKIDANSDGEIDESEAQNVSSLSIFRQLITDLSGIESFTNLKTLSCYENRIAALDLSQNTKLIELYCYNNFITSLNISSNSDLAYLSCYNNRLTSLDVTNNMALLQLHCNINQLTALDVSKNTALALLYCDNNQLTALDVSENTALTELVCNSNQLTAIDISKVTNLTLLHIYGNKITALDPSTNTKLVYIKAYDNQLTALDLNKNTVLQQLEIATNQIPSIDLSKNTALTTLYINSNKLTTLDLSKNSALTKLRVDSNELTALNLKNGIKGTSTNFANNNNIANICSDADEKTDIETLLSDYGYSVTVVTDCFETPPPTGSAAQTFCVISAPTVANLTATGSDIKWYNNATGGTTLNTTDALTNTTYYASQTLNGFESLTRLTVLVTVTDPTAPTGEADQAFCELQNATVADLVATGTEIKWYDVLSGGIALETTTTLTASTYYGSQTVDGCQSTARLMINVTLSPAVVVDAAPRDMAFCGEPTVADISAIESVYDVSTGGLPLATTTFLTNGVTYYGGENTNDVNACTQTTRYPINITINTTESPSGDTQQSFCSLENATIANLMVTGTDIKWYAEATSSTAIENTTALVNGTTYHASQTIGDCESSSRLAVTITINTIQDTPGAPPATMTFCSTNQPTVADLNATSNVYNVATGGNPLDSTTSLTTGNYYVGENTTDVATCSQSLRGIIQVTLNSTPAPTGENAQTFCGATTISQLIVTGNELKWYTEDTGDTSIELTSEVTATTYFVSQTIDGCESERLAITVTEECLGVTKNNIATTISLYPNPVQNELHIENAGVLQAVTIYNTQGQSVLLSTSSVINTSRLASGTYIVIIESNQGTVSKKIIKE